MKKLLLLMIASLLLFCGCTEKTRVITSYYEVTKSQWEPNITIYSDNTYEVNYYYSTWENVDITNGVINEGAVLVYYLDGTHDQMLPYTLYLHDDQGNLYQERIEFDVEPGVIRFKIKDNDFQTASSIDNIGTMKFKVTVIR